MPRILLVPVHLDVLRVTAPMSVSAPSLDPMKLPYVVDGRDVNPGTPYLSEATVARPFEDHLHRLLPGRHLHWSLPDALTREGTTGFPPAPNRWLITRTDASGPGERWVVESDYLAPAGRAPAPNSVPYPLANEPGAIPYRRLGRVMPLADWDPAFAARHPEQYLAEPLTAIGYGDPTFAALYAGCRGVFGMWDDAPGPARGARYDLLGWYADVARDPLPRLHAELKLANPAVTMAESLAAMRDMLGWTVADADALPDRIACWASTTVAPATRLTVGDPLVTVGVGTTGTEALAAYLASMLAPGHSDAVEYQLELAQIGGRLDKGTAPTDAAARFREARHENGFAARDAGTIWSVLPAGTGAAAADEAIRARLTLPVELSRVLTSVNELQANYDRGQRRVDGLRRQLFSDWYRYLLAAHEPGDALPDSDEVRDFVERRVLPDVEAAVTTSGSLTVNEDRASRRVVSVTGTPAGSIAGRLADALGELARAVDDLNSRPETRAAGISYAVSRGPAPRFWRPNDPVVLVTGPAVQPSVRHGRDGRRHPEGLLECDLAGDVEWLDTAEPPTAALSAAVAALPRRRIGFSNGDGRPWNPLLMQWMVELFPAHPRGSDDAPGVGYRPDHVAACFELPSDSPDLRLRDPELRRGANVYRGTSILTPNAKVQLEHVLDREAARVVKPVVMSRFFDAHAVPTADRAEHTVVAMRDAWNAWVRTQALDVVPLPEPATGQPPTEQLDAWLRDAAGPLSAWVVSRSDSAARFFDAQQTPESDRTIDGLRADLDGFLNWQRAEVDRLGAAATDAVAQLLDVTYVLVLHASIELLRGTPVLAQSLGGLHEALLMRHQGFQLGVADPFAFPDDLPFITRVDNAVAHQGRSAPQPLDDFNPLRAGGIELVSLRMIDTFGQWRDLRWERVVASEPLHPRGTRHPVLLPPRLAVPARLNMRWLAADSADQEMNDHPSTSPVCGWLLANFLDRALMVFDADGAAIGSITADPQSPWRAAPGADGRPSVAAIPSPVLRRVVRWFLARRGPDPQAGDGFLDHFIDLVENALEQIEPASAAHPAAQALLVGRPLAVVRASLALEVDGPLPVHQGWTALRRDMSRPARDTHGLGDVRFPVRLGEHGLLEDGVMGFWLDGQQHDTDTFPIDTFCAPQGEVPDEPALRAGGLLPFDQWPTPDGRAQAVCMLLDPRGKVHATCGVVPTKVVDLPADQYLPAMRAIAVPFLTAPVLTDRGQLRLTLPDEPGSAWSWVDRGVRGWNERTALGVLSRQQVQDAFGAAATTMWDRLIDKGWITADGPDRAVVVPEDRRKERALGEPDAVAKVEALLAGTRIQPFRVDAAFTAPQEIREGWLVLKTSNEDPAGASASAP